MFKLFGRNKEEKKQLEEIRRLKNKNRTLYLQALEKYNSLKTS